MDHRNARHVGRNAWAGEFYTLRARRSVNMLEFPDLGHLSCSTTMEDGGEGLQQNRNIAPYGPIAYVPDAKLDTPSVGGVAAPACLPKSSVSIVKYADWAEFLTLRRSQPAITAACITIGLCHLIAD